MDIQQLNGLPAHPLIVHLPVVLVPLATVGVLLMLVRPRWRHSLAVPTAVLATVAAIATQLAITSGEWLEEQVRESDLVEDHSRIAEQARPWIFLFALVTIGIVVVDLARRRRGESRPDDSPPEESPAVSAAPGGTALATAPRSAVRSRLATVALGMTVLAVGLGVVSTVGVYRTGHSGATATWHDVGKGSGSGGEADDDGD